MIADAMRDSLRSVWRVNDRVTAFLIEKLPDEIWDRTVPGVPRKTVRSIAGHLHNNRCSWIKAIGTQQGVAVPERIDRRTVTRPELVEALERSGRGILAMLDAALEEGGRMPAAPWQNYPSDAAHFVAYHVTHEGHHRGQIVLLARQMGHRLPAEVANGLWQWNQRRRETGDGG